MNEQCKKFLSEQESGVNMLSAKGAALRFKAAKLRGYNQLLDVEMSINRAIKEGKCTLNHYNGRNPIPLGIIIMIKKYGYTIELDNELAKDDYYHYKISFKTEE